jgi:hypothetical protein
VIGPPDVVPVPELLLLELEDAQADRAIAAAQATADLIIAECFTLVLLYSVHQLMRPM